MTITMLVLISAILWYSSSTANKNKSTPTSWSINWKNIAFLVYSFVMLQKCTWGASEFMLSITDIFRSGRMKTLLWVPIPAASRAVELITATDTSLLVTVSCVSEQHWAIGTPMHMPLNIEPHTTACVATCAGTHTKSYGVIYIFFSQHTLVDSHCLAQAWWRNLSGCTGLQRILQLLRHSRAGS